MIRALAPVLVLVLAACSEPLEDAPRGQAIPTEPVRTTIYAPGSGPAESDRSAEETTAGR